MISRFRPTRAQGLAHFEGGHVRGRETGLREKIREGPDRCRGDW